MPNVKGQRRGGRQKGTANKSTRLVKQALEEAFDQLGGVESLVTFGREHPTEFYKLWSKLLPKEAKIEHTGISALSEQERVERLFSLLERSGTRSDRPTVTH